MRLLSITRCFRFSLGPVRRHPVAKHPAHALHHQRYTIESPVLQSCPRVVILLLRICWNAANAFAPSCFPSQLARSLPRLSPLAAAWTVSSWFLVSGANFNVDWTRLGLRSASWNNGHVPTRPTSSRSINEPLHNRPLLNSSVCRSRLTPGTFNSFCLSLWRTSNARSCDPTDT